MPKYNSLILLGAALMSASVIAAENESGQSEENKAEEVKVSSPWSVGLSGSYSRNAYKDSAYNAKRTFSANVSVSRKFWNDYRFTVSGGGYRSLDGAIGWYETDIFGTVSKSNFVTLFDTIKSSASLRFSLPISELSRKDKLRTSVRGAIAFRYSPEEGLFENFTLGLTPRVTKNFHEYKTVGTRSLTEWNLSNLTSLSYSYGKWSARIDFLNSANYSYQGTRKPLSMTHTESISYQVTPKFGVSAGHTNSVTFFDREQGPDPVFEFFDERSSTFFISANYNF
ncbi:hypothetical protein [Thaumasiovibrio subtropicus]|uniref:hypothetical protein n=1 Tax=Thaumasiovibrio subtropicus TaxID=1891207 RepID=UPI000B35CC00|nr:hypothetical protein [Thaumasiovibrio subtropicus]